MTNGVELSKRFPQVEETFHKITSLPRGLRKPLKEELIKPFSVLGIPEESEFSEASSISGKLQLPSSIELAPFARKKLEKDVGVEGAEKSLVNYPLKKTTVRKKRLRDLISYKETKVAYPSWALVDI